MSAAGAILSREKERSTYDTPLSFDDYLGLLNSFGYQGVQYSLPQAQQEEISGFPTITRGAYKANGIVFACMLARMNLFKMASFQFRRQSDQNLFGNADLAPLEVPWPNGSTSDLLARMIQYADLAGNAFVLRQNDRLAVLRPDWVTIVGGSTADVEPEDATVWAPDAEVLSYVYTPGGIASGADPIRYEPSEIAHFAPIPDPEARFRGMSWISPIAKEVMADKAMTDHRLSFFENGATPNLVVKLDVPDLDKFKKWIEHFQQEHDGASNAYKTLYLGAGADATVVGADLKQLDFKITQGGGETRVAAAAGVPPVIVGLSEGLQAATYSNYGQARRRFNDGTMWPLWQDCSSSLATIIAVPSGAELCVDGSCIPALREDEKDAADIFAVEASSFASLVQIGVTAESAAASVAAKDITLVKHTGLPSVQLQSPGSEQSPANGSGNADNVPVPEGANQ